MTDSANSEKPTKLKIFLSRTISSIVVWSVVLLGLFAGGKFISDFMFLGVSIGLCVLGVLEFLNMAERQGLETTRPAVLFGTVLITGFPLLALVLSKESILSTFDNYTLVAFSCLLVFTSVVFSTRVTKGKRFMAAAVNIMAILYVPFLFSFIPKIYILTGDAGAFYVVFFILITKFSDVGAYLTGSLIGKHKMIPRLSPGKTWEGFFGAVIISTSIGILFIYLFGEHMPGMTLFHATALAIPLSMLAVLGDLVESLFKREAQLKDSGNFLPGIGGMLDLLDSLLFNAPFMYLYIKVFIQTAS